MLRAILKCVTQNSKKRLFSTTSVVLHRVTLIGAAGGIGQPLSMLLKTNSSITDLILMDLKATAGIGTDISHIDTFSGVTSFTGAKKMEECLRCSNLVVIAAGSARGGDASREALFDDNKDIIYDVATLKAKICPEAILVILTNPVNSLVPLAAEALKQANAYNSKKLFGICKTDIIRTRTFIGDFMVIDPIKITADVCGGHSENTIVPLLSSASPALKGDPDEWHKIYERVRQAGNAVIKAKGGKQSAQLCVAYAAASFCGSLLKGMDGKSGITDTAFVESQVLPEVKFFTSKVDLSKEGIRGYHKLPPLSDLEKKLLENAIPQLKEDIARGIEYAQSKGGKN